MEAGKKSPIEDGPSSNCRTPEKPICGTSERHIHVEDRTVEDVCWHLRHQGLTRWEAKFREAEITGQGLQYITNEDLEKMGIGPLGERLKVQHCLKKLWQVPAEKMKVFNDPIHGHIELHPLLVRIIDTPQFQRLRHIKQLGAVYYVYPGATHNRFEHSIGVAHLAGQVINTLMERQPELKIDFRDGLCVQIAGLCHDLGHGPFSHMFEKMFMQNEKKEWKHEQMSVEMFEYMVKENHLEDEMKKHGLKLDKGDDDDDSDLEFIKDLIFKHPAKSNIKHRVEKNFLYEIVANERTGIDVDKWDYFARDCYHLGIKNNFDHLRFLKFVRVCEVNGGKVICTKDKEALNLYHMFQTRDYLHRIAYQHPVTSIIETMIAEAFLKADEHMQIEGSNHNMLKISTAYTDMKAYTKLTDHIFEEILNSPRMEEAANILKNILCRKLYKCLGQCVAENAEDNLTFPQKETVENGVTLLPEDFIVKVITLDYGIKDKDKDENKDKNENKDKDKNKDEDEDEDKDKDPLKSMHFYNKNNPREGFPIKQCQVSYLLPKRYTEKVIRVYCRKIDDEAIMAAAKEYFKKWCKENGFEPLGADSQKNTSSP